MRTAPGCPRDMSAGCIPIGSLRMFWSGAAWLEADAMLLAAIASLSWLEAGGGPGGGCGFIGARRCFGAGAAWHDAGGGPGGGRGFFGAGPARIHPRDVRFDSPWLEADAMPSSFLEAGGGPGGGRGFIGSGPAVLEARGGRKLDGRRCFGAGDAWHDAGGGPGGGRGFFGAGRARIQPFGVRFHSPWLEAASPRGGAGSFLPPRRPRPPDRTPGIPRALAKAAKPPFAPLAIAFAKTFNDGAIFFSSVAWLFAVAWLEATASGGAVGWSGGVCFFSPDAAPLPHVAWPWLEALVGGRLGGPSASDQRNKSRMTFFLGCSGCFAPGMATAARMPVGSKPNRDLECPRARSQIAT